MMSGVRLPTISCAFKGCLFECRTYEELHEHIESRKHAEICRGFYNTITKKRLNYEKAIKLVIWTSSTNKIPGLSVGEQVSRF